MSGVCRIDEGLPFVASLPRLTTRRAGQGCAERTAADGRRALTRDRVVVVRCRGSDAVDRGRALTASCPACPGRFEHEHRDGDVPTVCLKTNGLT